MHLERSTNGSKLVASTRTPPELHFLDQRSDSCALEAHEIVKLCLNAPRKAKTLQGGCAMLILTCVWHKLRVGKNLLQARGPLLSSTSLTSVPTCALEAHKTPSLHLANQQESRGGHHMAALNATFELWS
jgi:hypothetical protein